MARISEQSVIRNVPPLSGPAGTKDGERLYICLAPHAWGRGTNAAEAVKNAKKNRYGRTTWQWLLFDCDSSVTINGMGGFDYYPDKVAPGLVAYKEVARFNVKEV